MDVKDIFQNNNAWVQEKLAIQPDYFEELSRGQSPEFLYIGCSDSRVSAEQLMGVQPGDVFVHRNIANMVPNTDLNALSVVNYAVVHLKVKHLVVCGHYYCGGVKAAMEPADLDLLNPWLRQIRDVYRLHQTELDEISDEEQRYRRLVELNVQEQCLNLAKLPEVQRAHRDRELNIHGWVFDIKTGKLVDLKMSYEALLSEVNDIYHLNG